MKTPSAQDLKTAELFRKQFPGVVSASPDKQKGSFIQMAADQDRLHTQPQGHQHHHASKVNRGIQLGIS